ncbi:TM1802 family CRISPR-associated protein [Campylobacter corcagiensis]|uniref:TM1802 family CRISPR-associated protein n=1 Tax=Campylobacter corcagiensis TaxID=1448857 RepID=UPI0004725A1A|nr:TM1802 family CRISPR-associated protein [Campylobacter corcagiensis]
MAILTTFLTDDESIIKDILDILQKTHKGDMDKIKNSEEVIDLVLENSSISLQNYPVLATILFYEKRNAAVNLFLTIDDVLPSYISYVAKTLAKYNIKAFFSKGAKNTIFLQNLFNDRLEIMQILLTDKKLNLDILLDKCANLINFGTNDLKNKKPVSWENIFRGYYYSRSIYAINIYIIFFNEINKINLP